MNKHNHHAPAHRHETPDLTALAEEARTLIAATSDAAGEKVAAARQRLSDSLDAIHEKVAESVKSSDQTIRENPYAAAGIALGAGVLLGVLLGRRSSRGE